MVQFLGRAGVQFSSRPRGSVFESSQGHSFESPQVVFLSRPRGGDGLHGSVFTASRVQFLRRPTGAVPGFSF